MFKKKIGSLLSAGALLFSLFAALPATASAAAPDYTASLDRMHSLGIISSSVTNGSSVVTRAQFLESVIDSEGMETVAEGSNGTTPYPDVAANSTLSGYVNAGISLGTKQGVNERVVYGEANGDFDPNSPMTYAEACTIAVRLLGYTDTDSQLANIAWPNNYIQEAANLGLTSGMSVGRSDNLTVKVEAVIFDRLFNTLLKGQTSVYYSSNYYSDATTSGTLKEAIVLGNYNTSDGLNQNQILTNIGTLTLDDGVTAPDVGGEYELYVDSDSDVTKIAFEENTLEDYTVKSISSAARQISYYDSSNEVQTMTLPEVSSYYYHGKYVTYDEAVNDIQSYSSIVLAKDSDGNSYGIIVDPNYGEPYVYSYDNVALLNKLTATKYDYIYREDDSGTSDKIGNISESDINDQDVIYFVSDLWGKHTFVYDYVKDVYGTITSFVPNQVNPTGVKLGSSGTEYDFNSYFDKTSLQSYDGSDSNFLTNTGVGDFREFILGIDGTIVGIYTPTAAS